jgi:hypothetical protein
VRGPHDVTVWLNQESVGARPGDGYEPLFGFVKAIEFIVETTSAEAACEIAYAVTNSYSDELHCPRAYLDVVQTYRDLAGFRAMTVDDVLEVDGLRFVCARFGFDRIEA